MTFRPKKHLGQHFLVDEIACRKIADAVPSGEPGLLIEIGPGKGALTKYLLEKKTPLTVVEFDEEAVLYLKRNFSAELKIIHADILTADWNQFGSTFHLAGNLPYNISSQVLFKVFENRHRVSSCVFMLQKEVAERLASLPGNRQYGILSVLIQAFYDVELLFTLPPEAFLPPPEVYSSVIRMKRNAVEKLNCDERRFISLVKTAFNQRRKKLSNALKSMITEWPAEFDFRKARAEELSWKDFEKLALHAK